MSERRDTFEVRVLKNRPHWIVLSTWDNSEEAAEEARDIIASRKYLGVRVVHEIFDPARNLHREKTILKHYKLHARWLAFTDIDGDDESAPRANSARSAFDDDFDPDDFDDDEYEMSTDRRAKLVAIVLCAVVLLKRLQDAVDPRRPRDPGTAPAAPRPLPAPTRSLHPRKGEPAPCPPRSTRRSRRSSNA